MKIIQVVGYKNSGKTTVTSHLISKIASLGIRVASIKHHGHGGDFEGISHTDSGNHFKSGAIIAGVAGENLLQLCNKKDWQLAQLISLYELFDTEVLIVEGFKRENYPKIVLLKEESDLYLIKQLTNIRAVMTLFDMKGRLPIAAPLFTRNELDDLCQYVIGQIL